MFQLREPYTIAIAAPTHRAGVAVGASPSILAEVGLDKADPKDLGLYVGLPAVGAGVVAALAGAGAVWALLAAVAGGGVGYLVLDRREEKEEATAAAAAKAAAEAKEKERRAKLSIVDVAAQSDAIGLQAKAGLALFSIGMVPGSGSGEVDYKLAVFPALPTDVVVKQLTDLRTALSKAGYDKAAAQIGDAATTAASYRDAGVMPGGTLEAPVVLDESGAGV